MIKKAIVLLLLFFIFPSTLYADEISVFAARSQDKNVGGKLFSATYTKGLTKYFNLSGTTGFFTDRNLLTTPTFFGEVSAGFKLEVMLIYIGVDQGFALLSRTPTGLNAHWQLPTTFGVGLKDDVARIGIKYKHFSNGTSAGNWGRNFLGFEIGFKF